MKESFREFISALSWNWRSFMRPAPRMTWEAVPYEKIFLCSNKRHDGYLEVRRLMALFENYNRNICRPKITLCVFRASHQGTRLIVLAWRLPSVLNDSCRNSTFHFATAFEGLIECWVRSARWTSTACARNHQSINRRINNTQRSLLNKAQILLLIIPLWCWNVGTWALCTFFGEVSNLFAIPPYTSEAKVLIIPETVSPLFHKCEFMLREMLP